MTELEKLFSAACNNKIGVLKKYYGNGGERNRRYKAFGMEHSLIAGAYRNGNLEVVKYLMSVGETITDKEKEEINLDKIELMEQYKYYVIHNKEKYYFDFSYGGFKEAQAFIENCGYKKRTIHVEKCR